MSSGALSYVRAAFIAYEPGGYPDKKRVIPFRINPELLSRSVAVEAGQQAGGVEGAAPGASPTPAGEESANASGAIKESFSLTIRLDLADRHESVSRLDPKYGVAPEIAAIEDLVYPAESESEAKSDGSEPVRAARERPTVLLAWGAKRVLPVRIASLKIDESLFNVDLYPVRAEIEASLEVVGAAEALAQAAAGPALEQTQATRRELARMFYENTASQASKISEPTT